MTFLLVLFLLAPLSAYGAGLNYWSYTFKAFGSLLLVLGLIAVFFFLLKKINSMGKHTSSRIKLKSRLYLDNRRYLAIVEVDGEELLLGVSDNITLLKELEKEHEED